MGRVDGQEVSDRFDERHGHFEAEALLKAEEYDSRAVSIAGDELSFEEASKIFKEEIGHEMPLAPCLVGSGLKLLVAILVLCLAGLGPMAMVSTYRN